MNRSVNPVPSDIKGMTVFNTDEVDYKKQPMFFGKPLGIQRYDSYKYPTFDRLTTQQLGYFWRPEEVSLQKDIAWSKNFCITETIFIYPVLFGISHNKV